MKIPKKTNRFCPYCNKKTEQKIDLVSTGHKRGTLKRASLARAKLRHLMGSGNRGKRSRKKETRRGLKATSDHGWRFIS